MPTTRKLGGGLVTDRRHLFYTRMEDRTDKSVLVEVWVDLDEAMAIAFNATRNKSRKACQGPVYAKVVKDDLTDAVMNPR